MNVPPTPAPTPGGDGALTPNRATPLATVLVCTRNRPEGLMRTLQSIALNGESSFEVIVVDQGDDDRARDVTQEFSPTVRYVHQDGRGLSRARNLGVQLARGKYILFTDDDCTVPPGWVEGMLRELESGRRIAAVYGRLDAIPHDWEQEYIPQFRVSGRRVLKGRRDASRFVGYGANFAFRRDVLQRLGLFDEALGAGARFRSCEDSDIARRALRRGWTVIVAPEPAVLHWGARSLLDGSGQRLVRDGLYAEGARIARDLRLRNPWASFELAEITRGQVMLALRALLDGRRPTGIRRIWSCYAGLVAGMGHPIDRRRRVFAGD